jgi:hypothetical protein
MTPLIILGVIAEGLAGAYLIEYFRTHEENIWYQVVVLLATITLWLLTIQLEY